MIASSMELASKNTLEFAGKAKEQQTVNHAKTLPRRGKGQFKGNTDTKRQYQKNYTNVDQKCDRCVGTKHSACECRFKNESCSKVEHIACACRNHSTAAITG